MIGHFRAPVVAFVVHDQADVFQKTLQVFELLQRFDQFLEILQTPRRFGRFVVLPMGGVAAFVQNNLGQFDMAQVRRPYPPPAHRSSASSSPMLRAKRPGSCIQRQSPQPACELGPPCP